MSITEKEKENSIDKEKCIDIWDQKDKNRYTNKIDENTKKQSFYLQSKGCKVVKKNNFIIKDSSCNEEQQIDRKTENMESKLIGINDGKKDQNDRIDSIENKSNFDCGVGTADGQFNMNSNKQKDRVM